MCCHVQVSAAPGNDGGSSKKATALTLCPHTHAKSSTCWEKMLDFEGTEISTLYTTLVPVIYTWICIMRELRQTRRINGFGSWVMTLAKIRARTLELLKVPLEQHHQERFECEKGDERERVTHTLFIFAPFASFAARVFFFSHISTPWLVLL